MASEKMDDCSGTLGLNVYVKEEEEEVQVEDFAMKDKEEEAFTVKEEEEEEAFTVKEEVLTFTFKKEEEEVSTVKEEEEEVITVKIEEGGGKNCTSSPKRWLESDINSSVGLEVLFKKAL